MTHNHGKRELSGGGGSYDVNVGRANIAIAYRLKQEFNKTASRPEHPSDF